MLQGSFVLDADDACHVLTVETGGPISSVALQSSVLLDLQECPVAILSLSPPDPANRSMTLATYRWVVHNVAKCKISSFKHQKCCVYVSCHCCSDSHMSATQCNQSHVGIKSQLKSRSCLPDIQTAFTSVCT